MGNVVVGEALRFWAEDNPGVPLVDRYVAMQAAISSGAYGSDVVYDKFGELPVVGGGILVGNDRDCYRYFPSAETIRENPNDSPLFGNSKTAAGKAYNVYDPIDSALGLWEMNTCGKHIGAGVIAIPSWQYEYRAEYQVPDDKGIQLGINSPIFACDHP